MEAIRSIMSKYKLLPPSSSTTGAGSTSSPKTGDEAPKTHFQVVRFMHEAGAKLNMKSVPLATAAMVYHRFFQVCKLQDYDPYLIATTSLYLAGKIEEDHLKLRDVINVSYRCLHKDKPPLDIGSTYWAMRETVAQCELFIMRALRFQVSIVHPHKYLLHYMKSLLDWLDPDVARKVPIARTAWAILRDCYHGNMCLRYEPEYVAVAVLYFSLQCHGIEVPHSQDAEYRWWEALVEDIRLERIRQIIEEIIAVYDMDNT